MLANTQVLASYAKQININREVMDMYLKHLLPGITDAGDDGNYGSCACYDVLCLQVCPPESGVRETTTQSSVSCVSLLQHGAR